MIPKILIIAPSWIGDTVMVQSLLKLLKQNNPSASIDILALPYLHLLLKRMPEANNILTSPFKHGELNLAKRFAMARTLKKEKYDQTIILPNSWKSALIPFLAKIPKRTAWRGEMRYFLINDIRILDKKALPLMVQRFAALGLAQEQTLPKSITFPQLTTNQETIAQTLQKLNLCTSKRPVLAFCIGAEYGETKRWPAHYFAAIAKVKAKEGWDIWLLGGTRDQKVAKIIQEQSNQICIDLTGKTNLAEVIDLLALAKIVITNDTGLMHIAAALNLPLIVIYGSSSPQFTPPLTKNAKILSLNLKCSPCFKRKCPLGHLKCMLDLTPEHILEVLKEFKNECINN